MFYNKVKEIKEKVLNKFKVKEIKEKTLNKVNKYWIKTQPVISKVSKYWGKTQPCRMTIIDQIAVGQELYRMTIIEANKRVRARKEKEKNNI